jgi:hypothetical protein
MQLTADDLAGTWTALGRSSLPFVGDLHVGELRHDHRLRRRLSTGQSASITPAVAP